MAKATKENRYPQGYLPKIQYWAEVLYNACEDNDIEDMDRAKARLDYFICLVQLTQNIIVNNF